MINSHELEQLFDIQSIDLSDKDMLSNAKQFFEKVKNPYKFKVDDIVVHVQFGDQTAGSLQSHVQNLLSKVAMGFT